MIFTGTTTQNDDGTTTWRQNGRVIARGKAIRFKNADEAWAYLDHQVREFADEHADDPAFLALWGSMVDQQTEEDDQ